MVLFAGVFVLEEFLYLTNHCMPIAEVHACNDIELTLVNAVGRSFLNLYSVIRFGPLRQIWTMLIFQSVDTQY